MGVEPIYVKRRNILKYRLKFACECVYMYVFKCVVYVSMCESVYVHVPVRL